MISSKSSLFLRCNEFCSVFDPLVCWPSTPRARREARENTRRSQYSMSEIFEKSGASLQKTEAKDKVEESYKSGLLCIRGRSWDQTWRSIGMCEPYEKKERASI